MSAEELDKIVLVHKDAVEETIVQTEFTIYYRKSLTGPSNKTNDHTRHEVWWIEYHPEEPSPPLTEGEKMQLENSDD